MSRTATRNRNRDIEDFHGHELTTTELTRPQLRHAALVICGRATDAADARHLLEMCGLAEYQRGAFTTYAFGRVKQP